MSLVISSSNAINITHQSLRENSSSSNILAKPAPQKVIPLEARVSLAPRQEISTSTVGTQAQMIAQSSEPGAIANMLEGSKSIASDYDEWVSEVISFLRDMENGFRDAENGLDRKTTKSDGIASISEHERMLLENKTRYIDILERAKNAGASHDPKAFLKTLNRDELAVLERVNGLGDPIAIDSLTHEGASNLLVIPGKQADMDRDGFIRTGNAIGFAFPPTDAPQAVVNAWNEATKGMNKRDVHTMQLSMFVQANGIDHKPGMTARFYADDFDWENFARNLVSTYRDNRGYQTTELQRQVGERMLKGYEAFLNALQR